MAPFLRTGFRCVLAVLLLAGNASAVTMTWLTVGDPGNLNDTADGDFFDHGPEQNFGVVKTK